MGRSMIVAAGLLLSLTACGTTKQLSNAPFENLLGEAKFQNPYLKFSVVDTAAITQITRSSSKNNPDSDSNPDENKPLRLGDFYIVPGANFLLPPKSLLNGPEKSYFLEPLSYDAADRGLLARWLKGYNVNFTLQMELTVDGVTRTLPLYTMSHNSNSHDGETFAQDLSLYSRNLFVRATGNSSINVNFDGKYTVSTDISLFSSGIQVAKTAVAAISPAAHMLTVLNKKSLQQQASVWDAALAQSLGETVEEKFSVALTPADWKSGKYGLLSLTIPGPDTSLDPSIAVGTWQIGFLNFRRSLFSPNPNLNKDDWDYPNLDQPWGVTANQVLNEAVGTTEEQTVETFLKSGAVADMLGVWSSDAKDTDAGKTDELKKAAATKEGDAADAVCRGTVDALYGLGLTTADARLGLWAMIEGMSLPGNPSSDHVRGLKQHCNGYIAPFWFAAEELPPAK